MENRVEIIKEFIEEYAQTKNCRYCDFEKECKPRKEELADNTLVNHCRDFLTELFLPKDKE